MFPHDPLFLSLRYHLLKENPDNFEDFGTIPYEWILPFSEIDSPGLYSLIPESFLIVLRPELFPVPVSSEFMRICETMGNHCLLADVRIPVPLARNNAQIFSVFPGQLPNTFSIRTTYGEKVDFYITPEPLIQTPFGTFLRCIGSLFAAFVDSARRGQSLPYIPCARLQNNNWLTQTSAVPLPTATFRSDASMHWHLTFVYRYAGLCAVQYLLGSPAFVPELILVDLRECFAVVGGMEVGDRSSVKFLFPPQFLSDSMVLGPFRAGLFSAGMCLGYEVEKVKVYLGTLLGLGPMAESRAEEARELSIADAPVKNVIDLVGRLIERSGDVGGGPELAWL